MVEMPNVQRLVVSGIALMLVSNAISAQTMVDPEGRSTENVTFAFAEVLSADPVYLVVPGIQREECYEDRAESDGTGGTLLGAVVGGALGNQVGGGDGRRVATLAGAVIGGAVGNNYGSRDQTQTRCRIIEGEPERREVVGYDVQYRYQGEIFVSRLDYDPGSRLRVRVSVTPAD
jgi:uncharacterized protein YcfJ